MQDGINKRGINGGNSIKAYSYAIAAIEVVFSIGILSLLAIADATPCSSYSCSSDFLIYLAMAYSLFIVEAIIVSIMVTCRKKVIYAQSIKNTKNNTSTSLAVRILSLAMLIFMPILFSSTPTYNDRIITVLLFSVPTTILALLIYADAKRRTYESASLFIMVIYSLGAIGFAMSTPLSFLNTLTQLLTHADYNFLLYFSVPFIVIPVIFFTLRDKVFAKTNKALWAIAVPLILASIALAIPIIYPIFNS